MIIKNLIQLIKNTDRNNLFVFFADQEGLNFFELNNYMSTLDKKN